MSKLVHTRGRGSKLGTNWSKQLLKVDPNFVGLAVTRGNHFGKNHGPRINKLKNINLKQPEKLILLSPHDFYYIHNYILYFTCVDISNFKDLIQLLFISDHVHNNLYGANRTLVCHVNRWNPFDFDCIIYKYMVRGPTINYQCAFWSS